MNSKQYIYETHLHTCEASACGQAHGASYISFYKEMGFAGIFVTDHFFNGNSCVDRSLPWKEKINAYCRGYEVTKEEGDRQNFDVFFGIEYNYHGDEYLIYGIDKEYLLETPEIMEWSHRELLENIHKAGGAVVQAHPYRVRGYLDTIYLHPHHVDGVEVFNKGNHQEEDALAYAYAEKYNLFMTGGSDIHWIPEDKSISYGVAFDEPLTSSRDYADAIRSGREHSVFCPDEGRAIIVEGYVPPLPVYLYDYDGQRVQLS